jgi:hypothetical protein
LVEHQGLETGYTHQYILPLIRQGWTGT